MTIGIELDRDLDLEFSRSNMEFTISRPKMVRLPRNEKQTYRLDSKPLMWPSDLTSAMTLTMNFQSQIWNLLQLSQIWFDCHKMKSTHIKWTEGLNDHRVWHWTVWGVRIYRIVTGVTSDVGVPSIRLVILAKRFSAPVYISFELVLFKEVLGLFRIR